MITVIIPTYNQWHYTESLLSYISLNKVLPKKIIVIDDGSLKKREDIFEPYKNLNIEFCYIRHETNIGLNYSWNEGFKLATTPLISLLNNDIIINDYFFKKIIESFEKDKKLGIVVPFTTKETSDVTNSIDEPVKLEALGKREGWACSANMNFIRMIKPIPNFLRTYCGDDYLFLQSKTLNFVNKKMVNNFIYHFVSKTVGVTPECFGELNKEKELFNKYLNG